MEKMKSFLDLEFSDAFMFAATMEDEELCREVLSRILEIPVKKVKVHKESTILINPKYRGVRMDVLQMMSKARFLMWRCKPQSKETCQSEAAVIKGRWM